jgi:lipopolysaccharide export system protein LptA
MYLIPKILLVFFCIYSVATYALDSDLQEKLNIVSDSGIYNFKTGVDVYEGHVQVDQGTTHIRADKLITKKNSEHRIQEATAYGIETLAHFWTLPKPNEPEIHAYSKIIKFYPLDSNVSLEHDVHVTQGENSFQGELIHYNNKEQTITLPTTTNGRAVLVYNPKK